MRNIEMKRITVDATPGSLKGTCIMECISLAREHQCDVWLIHNGDRYTINLEAVNIFIDAIAHHCVKA